MLEFQLECSTVQKCALKLAISLGFSHFLILLPKLYVYAHCTVHEKVFVQEI